MAEGPMETERITLSQRERDRLQVLHDLQQGRLTQVVAAQRMKLTDRQVRRLLLRLHEEGDRAAPAAPGGRLLSVAWRRLPASDASAVPRAVTSIGPVLAGSR